MQTVTKRAEMTMLLSRKIGFKTKKAYLRQKSLWRQRGTFYMKESSIQREAIITINM